MLLKDRVVLITNVEKFAGHGTTSVALAQGATVLAHDPSFEAPSARRKYETQFQGAHALSATDPVTMVELALKRHGHIDDRSPTPATDDQVPSDEQSDGKGSRS